MAIPTYADVWELGRQSVFISRVLAMPGLGERERLCVMVVALHEHAVRLGAQLMDLYVNGIPPIFMESPKEGERK